jgi:outer membrane protein W
MNLSRTIAILICGLFATAAHAGSISLVGLEDVSQNNATGFNTNSQSGTGEGILISGHLADRLALETGVLYYNHTWGDNTSGTNVISGQVLQVPLVFQMRIFRWFYIGAGGYYTSNSGDLKETGSTNNSNLTYASYGIKNNDYGWVGDAGLQFHILGRMFLRLEARYTSGSTNLATGAGNQFYTRDWQYLAGLTFYLGGGEGGKEYDIGSRR